MKPFKRILILGILLFLFGIVAIPFGILLPILKQPVKEIRFLVPGSHELVIEESGRYFVWNAFQARYEGKIYVNEEKLPFDFQLAFLNELGHQLPWMVEESAEVKTQDDQKKVIGYVDHVDAGKLKVEVRGTMTPRVFSLSQSNFTKYRTLIIAGAIAAVIVAILGAIFTLKGLYHLVRQTAR